MHPNIVQIIQKGVKVAFLDAVGSAGFTRFQQARMDMLPDRLMVALANLGSLKNSVGFHHLCLSVTDFKHGVRCCFQQPLQVSDGLIPLHTVV